GHCLPRQQVSRAGSGRGRGIARTGRWRRHRGYRRPAGRRAGRRPLALRREAQRPCRTAGRRTADRRLRHGRAAHDRPPLPGNGPVAMRAIATVTVVVADYDEAIEHYTRVLGFTLAEDTDLGGGKRWVTVV